MISKQCFGRMPCALHRAATTRLAKSIFWLLSRYLRRSPRAAPASESCEAMRMRMTVEHCCKLRCLGEVTTSRMTNTYLVLLALASVGADNTTNPTAVSTCASATLNRCFSGTSGNIKVISGLTSITGCCNECTNTAKCVEWSFVVTAAVTGHASVTLCDLRSSSQPTGPLPAGVASCTTGNNSATQCPFTCGGKPGCCPGYHCEYPSPVVGWHCNPS
jgi:hypothetical protein